MRDWPRRWPVGAWEPAWKVGFPQPFLDIVLRESKRANVPKSLVYAVIREESQFDRNALSGAEAYGLMQLIVPTARIAARKLEMVANSVSLMRPNVNIALGCQVLAGLLQQFDKQPILAIPAYNAGPGRPARWLKERPDMDFDVWVEAIPFAETRTYFKHVLSSRATYAWLYERDLSEATMRLPLRIGD
jgi:soluble lytic murein transglycosylase